MHLHAFNLYTIPQPTWITAIWRLIQTAAMARINAKKINRIDENNHEEAAYLSQHQPRAGRLGAARRPSRHQVTIQLGIQLDHQGPEGQGSGG